MQEPTRKVFKMLNFVMTPTMLFNSTCLNPIFFFFEVHSFSLSSPGAWHSWTLGLVIIYSWLWYPARYYIQNCLKTLSFYLWLLKWKSLFGKHNLQYKCFSQRASSKSYFFCFLQTMAFWRTQRHTDAVSEWLESGETFHVMRDHPDHNAPMPQETKLIKAMSSGKYLTICHLSRDYVAISHLHIAQYAINYFWRIANLSNCLKREVDSDLEKYFEW